jgi:hypothetical protein
MKLQLQVLNSWGLWIAGISVCSFLFSLFNLLVGRHVANKITSNDLKHLKENVKELKEAEKEYRVDLKEELHQINLSINRIEKRIVKREAICEERHSKDK